MGLFFSSKVSKDPYDSSWLQWDEFLLSTFENPFFLLFVMAKRIRSAEKGRQ